MNELKRITAITIDDRLSSKDIRRRLKQADKDKQPCFVCGKYQDITENHHVVHVKEVSALMRKGRIAPPLSIPVVWLCPNHHVIMHWLDGKRKDHIAMAMLSREEVFQVAVIDQERCKWWEKINGGIGNEN